MISASGSNGVGHFGAPPALWFGTPYRGVSAGLMLQFGVYLSSHEDDDNRQPDPDHETNHRAERAIGAFEITQIGRVKRKCNGSE